MDHITDHDLERYYLGLIADEAELAPIEEHLLWCHECLDAAERSDLYVDKLRAAATEHFAGEIERIMAKKPSKTGSAHAGDISGNRHK